MYSAFDCHAKARGLKVPRLCVGGWPQFLQFWDEVVECGVLGFPSKVNATRIPG
jgi:hypothetical protein